jgi:hypothetical protein
VKLLRSIVLIGIILLLFLSTVVVTNMDTNASSSSCLSVVNPGANNGNQYGYLPLSFGSIQENLWNLQSSSGSISQCTKTTGIKTTISLDTINYGANLGTCNVFNDFHFCGVGPAGYPEYGYGNSSYDLSFGSQNSLLEFPMQMKTFDKLGYWATVKYNLGTPNPSTLPTDFAYDLWLEQSPVPGQAPETNDLEVMIDLYNNKLLPTSQQYCLYLGPLGTQCITTPGFSEVGTYTTTLKVNGVSQSSTWDVYTVN